MEYRALALQRYKCLMDFNCQLLLLTATLPPTEEPDFLDTMGLTPERQCQVMRYPTCRSNLQFRVLGIPQPRKRGQLMPEKCEILGLPSWTPCVRVLPWDRPTQLTESKLKLHIYLIPLSYVASIAKRSYCKYC